MKRSVKNERKKEIFDVAIKLFAQKGFERTTMDEIAGMLNITKPALYFYFNSKNHLFSTLMKYKFQYIKEQMENLFRKDDDPLEVLINFIRTFINFGFENKEFFVVLTDYHINIRKRKSKHDKIMYRKLLIERLKNVFSKCIEKGYIREYDPYLLALSIEGMLKNIVLSVIMIKDIPIYKKSITPEKLIDIFFNGIALDNCHEKLKDKII